MKRDFVITYLGEAAVCIGALLTFKIVALRFGPDGFAEYALSRRIVSLLMPATVLGLAVGIPRFTAMAKGQDAPGRIGNYLLGGASALLGVGLLFLGMVSLWPKAFAALLLGSAKHQHLALPIGLMILGFAAYMGVYAHLRGRMSFTFASVHKVLLLAITPSAVCFLTSGAEQALFATGAFSLAASLALLVVAVSRTPPDPNSFWQDSKTLLSYGVRRVPGELSMAALLAAPATLTAHLAGIQAGGHVAFATSLLTMLAMAFSPIGLILLPKMSSLLATGNVGYVRKQCNRLLIFTLTISLIAVALFEIAAEPILAAYLPNSDPLLLRTCRILTLAGLFYPVYISLRSALDALTHRAANSTNTFLSLVSFCVMAPILYYISPSADQILFAFILSIALLSILTLTTYRHLLLTAEQEAKGVKPED